MTPEQSLKMAKEYGFDYHPEHQAETIDALHRLVCAAYKAGQESERSKSEISQK